MVIPYIPVFLLGCAYVITSLVMLYQCWTKLLVLRELKNVSKKTVDMQHQLALSISIQVGGIFGGGEI